MNENSSVRLYMYILHFLFLSVSLSVSLETVRMCSPWMYKEVHRSQFFEEACQVSPNAKKESKYTLHFVCVLTHIH